MLTYAVDVNRVVVTFVKVNVKTTVFAANGVTVTVVVTVTCIMPNAGAFSGTRETNDTITVTSTRAVNTALSANDLLKTTLV